MEPSNLTGGILGGGAIIGLIGIIYHGLNKQVEGCQTKAVCEVKEKAFTAEIQGVKSEIREARKDIRVLMRKMGCEVKEEED